MSIRDLAGRTTCTVEEAAGVLGIGRSLAYQLADRGELPSKKLGSRRVILVLPLLRMLGCEDLFREWASNDAA